EISAECVRRAQMCQRTAMFAAAQIDVAEVVQGVGLALPVLFLSKQLVCTLARDARLIMSTELCEVPADHTQRLSLPDGVFQRLEQPQRLHRVVESLLVVDVSPAPRQVVVGASLAVRVARLPGELKGLVHVPLGLVSQACSRAGLTEEATGDSLLGLVAQL